MKYETAWFYCHLSRELMRLKKGLIKIWRDLAKNKTNKKNKPNNKTKRLWTRKEVSINDGSGDGQTPKVHSNVLGVRYKTTHFLIYTEIVSRPDFL